MTTQQVAHTPEAIANERGRKKARRAFEYLLKTYRPFRPENGLYLWKHLDYFDAAAEIADAWGWRRELR